MSQIEPIKAFGGKCIRLAVERDSADIAAALVGALTLASDDGQYLTLEDAKKAVNILLEANN